MYYVFRVAVAHIYTTSLYDMANMILCTREVGSWYKPDVVHSFRYINLTRT